MACILYTAHCFLPEIICPLILFSYNWILYVKFSLSVFLGIIMVVCLVVSCAVSILCSLSFTVSVALDVPLGVKKLSVVLCKDPSCHFTLLQVYFMSLSSAVFCYSLVNLSLHFIRANFYFGLRLTHPSIFLLCSSIFNCQRLDLNLFLNTHIYFPISSHPHCAHRFFYHFEHMGFVWLFQLLSTDFIIRVISHSVPTDLFFCSSWVMFFCFFSCLEIGY